MKKLYAVVIILFVLFIVEFICFTKTPGYYFERAGLKSAIPGSAIYFYYQHKVINKGKVEVDRSILKDYKSIS